MFIQFTIPGRPVPWQRPAQGKTGGRFTPKAVKPQTERFKRAARDAMAGRAPLFGAVKLLVVGTWEIPKSWNAKLREAAAKGEVYLDGKPDVDNILKLALDSLNGIAFVDDGQIADGRCIMRYGLSERTEVFIAPLKPEGLETPSEARRRKLWKPGPLTRGATSARPKPLSRQTVLDGMV